MVNGLQQFTGRGAWKREKERARTEGRRDHPGERCRPGPLLLPPAFRREQRVGIEQQLQQQLQFQQQLQLAQLFLRLEQQLQQFELEFQLLRVQLQPQRRLLDQAAWLPIAFWRRRCTDEPIPIASRYFATVRRAMSKPLARSMSTS